jgi:ABC-type uncharacterized transport system involved in gliding motility auxiliary subunit
MSGTSSKIPSMSRLRWWKIGFGLNAAIAMALAMVLVLLINIWANRYVWRADWSGSGAHMLSAQTTGLLQSLHTPVEVVFVFQRGNELFREMDRLLTEYQAAAARLPFLRIQYVDPDRHLAQIEELARNDRITEANAILVRARGRSRIITSRELAQYDFTGVPRGQLPTRVRFTGEQAISSAIHQVAFGREPVLYVVSGHGERRIDNFDPTVGFSRIAQRMQSENIRLEGFTPGLAARVPEDADALLIAGPDRRWSQPEIDMLHAYLERSGRILMLLDSRAQTGLETLLNRWGVVLGNDVIVDPRRSVTGREVFVHEYGLHPVTERLQGLTTIFHAPRSITPSLREVITATADKPFVTVLAQSSPAGWAEREPDRFPQRFDPDIDLEGPVSLAVAVERGPIPGIDVQIRPTRMVVVGDSGFVANGGLTGGDEDFFMSALNWLLDREELMGISPRDVVWLRIVMDREQARRLFLWTVIGMPAVAIMLGTIVHWRRRY